MISGYARECWQAGARFRHFIVFKSWRLRPLAALQTVCKPCHKPNASRCVVLMWTLLTSYKATPRGWCGLMDGSCCSRCRQARCLLAIGATLSPLWDTGTQRLQYLAWLKLIRNMIQVSYMVSMMVRDRKLQVSVVSLYPTHGLRSRLIHSLLSGGLCVSVGYLPHGQLASAAHQAHARPRHGSARSPRMICKHGGVQPHAVSHRSAHLLDIEFGLERRHIFCGIVLAR